MSDYPVKLVGMAQAYECPECMREGGSLEHTEFHLEEENHLRIEYGWECCYCYENWSQTIMVKLGDVVSNTVELLT